MVISKIKVILFVCVISTLVLFFGSVYAEYYEASKSCINGCCTYSSEYSKEPYVPKGQMNSYISPWGPFPAYSGSVDSMANKGEFCMPYRQGTVGDYLCAGQYRIYCFATTGKRTYMEWILDGSCTPGFATIMGLYPQFISQWRKQQCNADFDLYVYQNTEPGPYAAADISDTTSGSNAYVGWVDPCQDCYYCVVVYCKQGCGYYYLTTNSYVDLCLFGSKESGSSGGAANEYIGTYAQHGSGNQNQYYQETVPSSQGAQPSQVGTQTVYPSQQGAGNQNQYYQETNPPSQGAQPAQAGTHTTYPSQQGAGNQNQYYQETNPPSQGAQPSYTGTQTAYPSQQGAGDQNQYSQGTATAAGASPSGNQAGDELSPGEQPWGAQYPISMAIGNESGISPEEQPWSPQYTPGPTEDGSGSEELKPEEEAWTPHYAYLWKPDTEDTSIPDEQTSIPGYNITNITNVTNITNITNITNVAGLIPDIYGIRKPDIEKDATYIIPGDSYFQGKTEKMEKDKNQWYW